MADIFIAKEPIFIGRARAHNTGDVVPASNVKRNGWEDLVAKQGTKAADAVAPVPSTPDLKTDKK
ncbi:MAG: hypothetical protein ACR2JO_08070 [Mycobacteriales bacterium]